MLSPHDLKAIAFHCSPWRFGCCLGSRGGVIAASAVLAVGEGAVRLLILSYLCDNLSILSLGGSSAGRVRPVRGSASRIHPFLSSPQLAPRYGRGGVPGKQMETRSLQSGGTTGCPEFPRTGRSLRRIDMERRMCNPASWTESA